MEITQEVAQQLVRYEPETGKLYWRLRDISFFSPSGDRDQQWNTNAWNARHAGKEITCSYKGYIVVGLFDHRYFGHRIIWLLNTGVWPDQIDHINGVTNDNRMENLRSVTNADNRRNMKRFAKNKSGATGVRWHKKDQKWHARVTIDSRTIHVGSFDVFDEAVAARRERAIAIGYHPNHGRVMP